MAKSLFLSPHCLICLPLHRTCKPSKIYDILAVFYGPKGTIYSQLWLHMAAHVLGMKKEFKQMLVWQCINNRSHHSGLCHYLLGKLSSCSSAVVSGNKLMCCRDYTESDRNNFSQDAPATNSNTRAHTCALGLYCVNTEVTEWAECYHHVLSALYFFFLPRTPRSLLPPSLPCYGPDEEVARPK